MIDAILNFSISTLVALGDLFPETLEMLNALVMEEEGGTIFGLNGTTAHHFITLQSISCEEEKQHTNMDNVDDANDLLKNGIIVETNKGLVCVPLKDLLISGVGGLSLSVEDFQNVAAQLLIQQNTDKITTVETLPVTEAGIDTVTDGSVITDKTHNLSSAESPMDLTMSEALVAQFQTDSDTDVTNTTTAPLDLEKPVVNQVKKRGGWPKGRKRKPELQGMRPPKAPATGYVLYSNEKRPLYKDLPFPEVTKILGNEWSKLGIEEKRVYLERAEVDKKRYREELKIYRQSDAYRAYLRRKRNKNLQGNGTEESDMDGTDEIEDEDNKELYCRTCDQWFSSFHNKKEHLYGRQHLQAIAGDFTKERLATEQGNGISSGFSSSSTHSSPDESSMDGTSTSEKSTSSLDSSSKCVSVTDSIAKFMEICAEQEQEVKSLRLQLAAVKTAHQDLISKVFGLKEKHRKLTAELEQAKEKKDLLVIDLLSLCTVPSLFEVS